MQKKGYLSALYFPLCVTKFPLINSLIASYKKTLPMVVHKFVYNTRKRIRFRRIAVIFKVSANTLARSQRFCYFCRPLLNGKRLGSSVGRAADS